MQERKVSNGEVRAFWKKDDLWSKSSVVKEGYPANVPPQFTDHQRF